MYTAIMFTYGSLMIEVIGNLDGRIELIVTQFTFTTNYMAVNYLIHIQR